MMLGAAATLCERRPGATGAQESSKTKEQNLLQTQLTTGGCNRTGNWCAGVFQYEGCKNKGLPKRLWTHQSGQGASKFDFNGSCRSKDVLLSSGKCLFLRLQMFKDVLRQNLWSPRFCRTKNLPHRNAGNGITAVNL